MKRAVRRHHKRRMKAKAIRVYGKWQGEAAAKYADHLALCSLSCCGNPRKWHGELTMQERKQKEREHDQWNDSSHSAG